VIQRIPVLVRQKIEVDVRVKQLLRVVDGVRPLGQPPVHEVGRDAVLAREHREPPDRVDLGPDVRVECFDREGEVDHVVVKQGDAHPVLLGILVGHVDAGLGDADLHVERVREGLHETVGHVLPAQLHDDVVVGGYRDTRLVPYGGGRLAVPGHLEPGAIHIGEDVCGLEVDAEDRQRGPRRERRRGQRQEQSSRQR